MANVYFNLNQIQSNPDGQPTVKRQSRLTSNPREMNKKEQMSSTCPRFALVLPSFCSRLDSLSLVSRQSDLDQVRAVSVGLSARVWKHVAMIFAVLVMSIANIDMVWGADFTPAQIVTSGGTTTDHVKVSTVFGTQTNKQFCSSETGLTGVNVNNSASANWNSYYIEIAATDGYTLSSLSLKVASSGSSNATEAVAFWNGAEWSGSHGMENHQLSERRQYASIYKQVFISQGIQFQSPCTSSRRDIGRTRTKRRSYFRKISGSLKARGCTDSQSV